MSCRTGTREEQPRYVGGTAVLPQQLDRKPSLRGSRARRPLSHSDEHFVKPGVCLLRPWQPNSSGDHLPPSVSHLAGRPALGGPA